MPGYRFGKHPPKTDYRTLRFRNYLTPGLPPPPPDLNTLMRVYDHTHISDPTKLFPMDGNDTLGDCTIAALAHAITVFGGMAGQGAPKTMAQPAVVKTSMTLTGV